MASRLTDEMLRDLVRRFGEHDPKCPDCKGKGRIAGQFGYCSSCKGTGDFALSADVARLAEGEFRNG